jgi:hypothetical protein
MAGEYVPHWQAIDFRGRSVTDGRDPEGPSPVGLLAAAAWAVGLAVGLAALIAGHPVAAAVAAIMGLLAPWFGLGWIGHTSRRADDADLAPTCGG